MPRRQQLVLEPLHGRDSSVELNWGLEKHLPLPFDGVGPRVCANPTVPRASFSGGDQLRRRVLSSYLLIDDILRAVPPLTGRDVLGNATAEKVLLYVEQYGEGYAKAIADTFGVTGSMVQRQLERFVRAGLPVIFTKGRTRLFTWNPRYAFLKEIRTLLRKALQSLPENERNFTERPRPRRPGKPL